VSGARPCCRKWINGLQFSFWADASAGWYIFWTIEEWKIK
jgi:hypothetical protein